MEKKQAIQLISDTFNAKFDENQFSLFIKNLLNDIEPKTNRYSGQMLWDDYKDHINSYKRIGKYTDPEDEPLDVLIVEVKTIAKLERARTSLRNFVIKHLKKFEKDFALVAFYAEEDNGIDWRFSFIKLEHQSYFDVEKDKVKIKEALTPAKRYSFLVGEFEQSHTAKTQLLPLLQNLANNPTIEELESAFSIEKVTDEFFNQYKDLYVKLYEHFNKDAHIKTELNKAKIDNARFTKKLLGQIVFLYFLQKKGWLGVPQNEKWGKGQKRFIQKLFDKAEQENVNFFKDKLQYLFYEALAKERNNENSFYNKFDCRIPFLNGGLFEAEYKWETANITIPTTIFRNQEKNKAGDIGTGVLDVFDRYNFTIKEDEPLDKEVAVDPEMLGKVFENMLEITERKSKGAFYTPREIVHYMCQESLIHYLDNALEGTVKKEDIETYIRKGHNALENDQRVAKKGETKTYQYILPKSIRKNADLIDQKLIDIKICDPAIGSGAFPVGLLHELVNAQLVIKPHFTDNYLNAKLKEFGFTKKDKPSESRYIYRLKRHIIQESIYGVDIDASAIDIARLRLWLSLVVDEDDFDPIETLPNLDYKIVCGNSLISRYPLNMPIDNVFKEFNKKVQSTDYSNNAIKNLVGKKEIDLAYYKKLTNDFLMESSHDKKVLFRELISEIKNAFTTTLGSKALIELSKARGAIENLKQSDIFGKQVGTKTQISNAKKHFAKLEKEKKETEDGALFKNAIEWRFEFPNLLDEEGDFVGFDVVIGNPPYGELIKEGKDYFKNNYKSTEGKYETYKYFIERGLQLYNNKGCEVYITPDTWISLGYFKKLRESIIKSSFVYLITQTLYDVFKGATVDNNIFILSNSQNYSKTQLVSGNLKTVTNINLRHLENDYSLVLKPANKIIDRIDSYSNKINDYCEVWQGLIAYGSKSQPREWTSLEKESDEHKKLLYGGDIGLFSIKWKEEYLKYGSWLHRPRPVYIYEQPHILVQRIRNPRLKQRIKAAIDREFHINGTGTSNILIKENSPLKLEEILCLINSELINYWFSYYYFDVNIKPEQLRQIPLPSLSTNSLNILERYLETSLKNEESNVLFSFFWSLANTIVYELYFEQEIKQANKEVLKHLTHLKPIDNEMAKEEKLAIIQAEFERLYHPEHPVRFAVETLDSIEEVRIIKEALK